MEKKNEYVGSRVFLTKPHLLQTYIYKLITEVNFIRKELNLKPNGNPQLELTRNLSAAAHNGNMQHIAVTNFSLLIVAQPQTATEICNTLLLLLMHFDLKSEYFMKVLGSCYYVYLLPV